MVRSSRHPPRRALRVGAASVLCCLALVVGSSAASAVPGDHRVIGSTWVLPAPTHLVALDPQVGEVFVSDDGDSRIRVVDTRTGRRQRTVHGACCGQQGLAVDPGTGVLYASGGEDGMFALPRAGGGGRSRITFSDFRLPADLTVDTRRHVVYAIDGFYGDVVEVDGRTRHETAFIGVGMATGLAVDPDSSTLYAADEFGRVWAVDSSNGRLRLLADLHRASGTFPTLAWDPALRRLHVLLAHQIVSIDPTARSVVGRAVLPRGFYGGLAVDAARHLLYVTRSWDDDSSSPSRLGHQLVLVDTRASRVVEVLDVGQGPSGLAVDTTSGRAYVACRDRLVTVAPVARPARAVATVRG